MTRTSLSLASGLAAALLLVTSPTAHAAVNGKDLPTQGDIVAAFPELTDGTFSTEKVEKIGLPDTTCGETTLVKVKSGTYTSGASATVYPIVLASVVELKSVAKAKSYMALYRKYAKKCASYTQADTGTTVTITKGKTFRYGDESFTVDTQSVYSSSTNYSSSVLTRVGKRISSVVAVDDAAVPASSIKPLAKAAAKKLK